LLLLLLLGRLLLLLLLLGRRLRLRLRLLLLLLLWLLVLLLPIWVLRGWRLTVLQCLPTVLRVLCNTERLWLVLLCLLLLGVDVTVIVAPPCILCIENHQ
jgi:hypothetical protein